MGTGEREEMDWRTVVEERREGCRERGGWERHGGRRNERESERGIHEVLKLWIGIVYKGERRERLRKTVIDERRKRCWEWGSWER